MNLPFLFIPATQNYNCSWSYLSTEGHLALSGVGDPTTSESEPRNSEVFCLFSSCDQEYSW